MPSPSERFHRIESKGPKCQHGRGDQAKEVVPTHRDGRFPSIAVHVDHSRLGKLVQQSRSEKKGSARAFGPSAATVPLAQPRDKMPEVVGRRLSRLAPHHRLERIEQVLVPFGEVWERGTQNRRHVVLRETAVGIVERVEQFLVPPLQHETGSRLLLAIAFPHPIASGPTTAERAYPDIADEFGEAEHARVMV